MRCHIITWFNTAIKPCADRRNRFGLRARSQKDTRAKYRANVWNESPKNVPFKRSTLLGLTMYLGWAILPGFTSTAAFGQVRNSPNANLALVGAKVFVSPSEEPIQDGVVLVEGGKIAAVGSRLSVQVPQTARLFDCSGRTVTAGFWNSHVHLGERKWADAATISAAELERQLQA